MTLTKFNITPDQRKELCEQYAVLSMETMDYDDMQQILVDKIFEEVNKYSTPKLIQHIIDYCGEETLERLLGGVHHGE
jgi:hypothetical protein